MTGSLIALAAKGHQDVRLTYKPQRTHWKTCYKRHTNFSIETIEGQINGQIRTGGVLTHTLQRNGDLASRTYLVLEFTKVSDLRPRQQSEDNNAANHQANAINDLGDNVRLVNAVGFHAIEEVRCIIGGHEFDKQTGFDMRMLEDLCTDERHRYRELIGDFDSDSDGVAQTAVTTGTAAPTEIVRFFVPMWLWWTKWCRRDQALPLIGLQYHTVQLQVRIRRRSELIKFLYNQDAAGLRNINCGSADAAAHGPATTNNLWAGGELQNAFFLTDFVFLDTRERKAFSCKCLEYLIVQTQQQTFSCPSGFQTHRLDIHFNHPMVFLSWFLQRQCPRDENDWDDWTGFTPIPAVPAPPNVNPPSRDTDSITHATLKLNSQNLHQRREAVWWRLVAPGDHGAYRPDLFFYTIPFALCICDCAGCGEGKDPSGSINFSRIDNVQLEMEGDGIANSNRIIDAQGAVVDQGGNLQCYVFGQNFNYGKVAAGMFGLFYAN